jgi:signal transduction histidine kinase
MEFQRSPVLLKTLITLTFITVTSVYAYTQVPDSLQKTLDQLPDSMRTDVCLALSKELKLSDPQKAFVYGQQAVELATSAGDPLLTGQAYMAVAEIYLLWAEYDKSLTYLLPALDEFENAGSQSDIALCCNNIGMVYMAVGDYANAETYYNRALDLNKGLKNYAQTVNTLSNIGTNYVLQDSTEKGLSFYLVSLMIADSLKLIKEQVNLLNSIGNSYSRIGRHEDALEHYYKALNILENDPDDYSRSQTLVNIAGDFYITGKMQPSLTYAKDAFDLSGRIGDGVVMSRAGKLLSDIYLSQNDYRQAYHYYVTYKNIADTIISAERAQELIKIQARHDLDLKEREITSLKEENESKLKANRIQGVVIVAIACLLAILVTLIYFLVKLNRKYKELNVKLAQQGQELEILNDQKDKFFSFVAHNLKNPFNTIMGFAELMQRSTYIKDLHKVKQYSTLIYNLSSQVQKVLSNLLEWSRLQRRTFEFKPEPLELTSLIRDVIEMNNKEAARKDLRIEVTGNESVNTNADRTMITTVIQNLISNAVNFTPVSGRVSVDCRRKGNLAEVSVTDSGVGIAEEDIPRLFQYDIMKTRIGTGENKGAGLGLILCKEMMVRNNGDIFVRSKPGKGSEFIISLPAIEPENIQNNVKVYAASPEDVIEELLSCRPTLSADALADMQVTVVPKFREVSSVLSLDNIGDFAGAVFETGEKYSNAGLTGYGALLKDLLRSHQIDQIIKILPCFREFLDKVETKN